MNQLAMDLTLDFVSKATAGARTPVRSFLEAGMTPTEIKAAMCETFRRHAPDVGENAEEFARLYLMAIDEAINIEIRSWN